MKFDVSEEVLYRRYRSRDRDLASRLEELRLLE